MPALGRFLPYICFVRELVMPRGTQRPKPTNADYLPSPIQENRVGTEVSSTLILPGEGCWLVSIIRSIIPLQTFLSHLCNRLIDPDFTLSEVLSNVYDGTKTTSS